MVFEESDPQENFKVCEWHLILPESSQKERGLKNDTGLEKFALQTVEDFIKQSYIKIVKVESKNDNKSINFLEIFMILLNTCNLLLKKTQITPKQKIFQN